MCRQTGNLWFILIEKGRGKKGERDVLMQNEDFYGYIYSFSSKKFGYSKLMQYLCTTRTRQASPRCSNVRVVLFLYNGKDNSTVYKSLMAAWTEMTSKTTKMTQDLENFPQNNYSFGKFY